MPYYTQEMQTYAVQLGGSGNALGAGRTVDSPRSRPRPYIRLTRSQLTPLWDSAVQAPPPAPPGACVCAVSLQTRKLIQSRRRSRSMEGYPAFCLQTWTWRRPGPQTCAARVWGSLRTLKFSRPPVLLAVSPRYLLKITPRPIPAPFLPPAGVDTTCLVFLLKTFQ